MNEGPVRVLYVDLDESAAFPLPELLAGAQRPQLQISRGELLGPERLSAPSADVDFLAVNVGGADEEELASLAALRQLVPSPPLLVIADDEEAERRVWDLEPHDSVVRDLASRGVLLRFIRRSLARGKAAGSKLAAQRARRNRIESSIVVTGARQMLEQPDCHQAATIAVATGKRLTGAAAGLVALFDPDGTAELFVMHEGEDRCRAAPRSTQFAGLGQIACSTGTVFDNAFASSPMARLLPEGHLHLDNVLFAPLLSKARPIGLLGLGNKPGGFDENDSAVASLFAEVAAISFALCHERQAQTANARRLGALLDRVGPPAVAADGGGAISVWSSGAEEAFGWKAQEMMGKPVAAFAAPSGDGQARARRRDGTEVMLRPVPLGEAGTAFTSAPLAAGTAYEITSGLAHFGVLRRLSGNGRALRETEVAGETCHRVLHGLDAPCADCPVRLPLDTPWPRVAIRTPKGRGSVELVTAELVDGSTARITVHAVGAGALGALFEAKIGRLAEDSALSERERAVFRHLLMGRTLEDIAAALGISIRTVKFHQTNVLEKVGASSRADLVRLIV